MMDWLTSHPNGLKRDFDKHFNGLSGAEKMVSHQ
jgi:hypothetical protein